MLVEIKDTGSVFDDDVRELFCQITKANTPTSVCVSLDDVAPDDGRRRIAIYHRFAHVGYDDTWLLFAILSGMMKDIEADPSTKIVRVYVDLGLSGRYTDNREAFLRMLKDCDDGKIDKIAVSDISRITRNMGYFEEFLNHLEECGVSFQSQKDFYDTDRDGYDRNNRYGAETLKLLMNELWKEKAIDTGHRR